MRSLPAAPTQCMLGTHTANARQIVFRVISAMTVDNLLGLRTTELPHHIAVALDMRQQ